MTVMMSPAPNHPPEYSVTELSNRLKQTVEDAYGRVRVRGEIGSCNLHSSGHLYLSLKENNAVLAGVCWRGSVLKLAIRPETGMEVVCTGKVTTYAGQSKYQILIDHIELAGEGALLKMLEERKKKLAAEGLFDQARKKPLPYLPEVIGVVTSPTGAVIRDILHRLEDRFPRRVILWPVPVQGEGASAKIAAAIHSFNALTDEDDAPRPDVLIVGRGGGSLEDLMPFNEEDVVRAIAASQIPVISAVGHETDTSLSDYAADKRAPTPTAAAEMAVPVRSELITQVAQMAGRLSIAAQRGLSERREKLSLFARAMGDPMRAMAPLMQRLDERTERFSLAWQNYWQQAYHRLHQMGARLRHPQDALQLAQQRLQNQDERLQTAARQKMEKTEKQIEHWGTLLQALSPRAVLGRGYSLVYDSVGRVLTRSVDMKAGDQIKIELQDGARDAVVTDSLER